MSLLGSGLEKLGDCFLLFGILSSPQHPGRFWSMGCVPEAPSLPKKRLGLEIDHSIQSSAGIRIGVAALVHCTSAIAIYTGTTFYRKMSYNHNTSYFHRAENIIVV